MVSFGCHCGERQKPVQERNWVVLQRCCNHSAFNGYHWTPSDYSTVFCRACQALGRTNARYVDQLKDAPPGDFL
jgi:late competence protein required for DNA uptake (superfamily II DNA/RNA helicase)